MDAVQIHCGQETDLISQLMKLQSAFLSNEFNRKRLTEGGITQSLMDSAVRAFVLELFAPALHERVLCTRDAQAVLFSKELARLFPNSKFILLLRGGRAAAHSIISRMFVHFI